MDKIPLSDAAEIVLQAFEYLEGKVSLEMASAVTKAIMTSVELRPTNGPTVPLDTMDDLLDALRADGLDHYADEIEAALQRRASRDANTRPAM